MRETQFPPNSFQKGFTLRATRSSAVARSACAASIAQNEPVLAQRILNTADTMVGRLNPGMNGVTIHVNETSSVGGFVSAGTMWMC